MSDAGQEPSVDDVRLSGAGNVFSRMADPDDKPVRPASPGDHSPPLRLGDVIDAIQGRRTDVDAESAVRCLMDILNSKRRWRGRFRTMRHLLADEIEALRAEGFGEIADRLMVRVADPVDAELPNDPRSRRCQACAELRQVLHYANEARNCHALLRRAETSGRSGPRSLSELDEAFRNFDEAMQIYSYARSGVLVKDGEQPEF